MLQTIHENHGHLHDLRGQGSNVRDLGEEICDILKKKTENFCDFQEK